VGDGKLNSILRAVLGEPVFGVAPRSNQRQPSRFVVMQHWGRKNRWCSGEFRANAGTVYGLCRSFPEANLAAGVSSQIE
jgi:hypothetical protein